MQAMTIQEAIAEICTPPEYEEIEALDIDYAEQRQAIKAILASEEMGEVSSDEADESIVNVLEDHNEAQLEIFDLEPVGLEGDDEDEESGFNANSRMVSFSAGFGQMLAELIDSSYENVEDAIADISAQTGIEADDIPLMLSGQLVPDQSGLEAIAELFAVLQNNEQAYQEFMLLGNNAYGEAIAETEPEPEPVATMSADMRLRAEFAALQERETIGDNLRNIERACDRMVSEGRLTPYERQLLLGEFEERSDRVAAFSVACEQEGIAPSQQLDRINFYLYVANQRGDIALFSQPALEPLTPVLDQESVSFVGEYRDRKGFDSCM